MSDRLRRGLWRARRLAPALAWLSVVAAPAAAAPPVRETPLDLRKFELVRRESGPVNYYAYVDDPGIPYLRAHYRPELKSAILGYEIPDADRESASALAWKWRAIALPKGANQCAPDKGDSAAGVILMWKRGLKWYELRLVWGSTEAKGAVCDRHRSLFLARETVILESGPPLGTWISEKIDLRKAFREHFADGDASAEVPGFVGIGLSTDGDQMASESIADYAGFALSR